MIQNPSTETGQSLGGVFDERTMEIVVNRHVRMHEILDIAGIKCSARRFRCPFHDGSSDSAAIFRDEDGDRLYCFSEERIYRPSDVCRKGLVDFSLKRLFDVVWSQLTDEQKIASVGESKNGGNVHEDIDFSKGRTRQITDFRMGRTSYESFMETLLDIARER